MDEIAREVAACNNLDKGIKLKNSKSDNNIQFLKRLNGYETAYREFTRKNIISSDLENLQDKPKINASSKN